MNFMEITDRLGVMIELINDAYEEYANLLYEIEKEKSHLYMLEEVMGLKNAEMRDAYVSKALDERGLLEKKLTVGNNFYRLKTEKELLIEISKNLRVIGE